MTKVDWTKWSAIAEIFGAIAIVATLMYLSVQTTYLAQQTELLAVQTQQNNTLLENEARYNLNVARTAEIEQLALEPELSAIWLKVEQGEELTLLEQRRYTASVQSRLVRWEWYYEQYRDGLIEEDVLPVRVWRIILQNPQFRGVWTTNTQLVSPDFVTWMEDNVIEGE